MQKWKGLVQTLIVFVFPALAAAPDVLPFCQVIGKNQTTLAKQQPGSNLHYFSGVKDLKIKN